jgi:peroxiredoxin Q/BCP
LVDGAGASRHKTALEVDAIRDSQCIFYPNVSIRFCFLDTLDKKLPGTEAHFIINNNKKYELSWRNSMVLEKGVNAPDFELKDSEGKVHKLSDYRGEKLVLYFYPKDDTPGCTKEACSFRDSYADFKKAGVTIIGISPDEVDSHKKFKDKYSLPFTLLADPDHMVCDAYGVWGLKKSFGREYEGVYRTTFIIGEEGQIQRVFENVKPSEHSQEVLSELGK